MGAGYTVAYRLGIKPWERTGEVSQAEFQGLLDREEADRPRPLGRALDLGCGTGAHTRLLNERGWDVMGIDSSRIAVDIATDRGGESSRYVLGDVGHLDGSGVGKDFSLFVDIGCFQGLSTATRAGMGAGVTQLATPDATVLMFSFRPNRNPLLPRGADEDDVLKAFPGWTMLDVRPADTANMRKQVRRYAPQWFRLGRPAA
ncbi:MAG: class I SAM-dependent methyltransferase [Nocardioides sp.]